jgi:diguanylate cyclase (GGDEF)-like protein
MSREPDSHGRDDAPAPADEDLLEARRSRASAPLTGRDRYTSLALGGGFAVTAAALAALLPWHASPSPLLVAALVAAFAALSRLEFEIGPGSAVPTQLVFVPMLFLLPPAIVPLAVGCGYLLGNAVEFATGRMHVQRALVHLSSSWFSVGPALVLSAAAPGGPRWDDWPLYAAALGAQFGFDLLAASTRELLAFGNRPRAMFPFLAWVLLVDALLAPMGLLAAFSSRDMELAFLLVLAPAGLLALLARDRKTRIDRALAFNNAYRKASEAARRDPLTGLANRLAWHEAVARADAGLATSGEPASVVLIDLDGLKAANDERGHAFGDELIRALAGAVAANVRRGDVVARIGGDEFGVLVPGGDTDACVELVARLTEAIDRHPELEGFRLSASLGFASCPPEPSLAEALERADAELYDWKRRRGARVRLREASG